MLLYHTAYREIRDPDVHYGRKNADFAQGFYLSPEYGFARRWARERKGTDTFINCYELDTAGLRILRLERNADWYDYIFRNRGGGSERFPDADVIIGPIANDTIYNTYGVLTSGLLEKEEALELLLLGPEYTQVVLKTEKAACQLKWLKAEVLTKEQLIVSAAEVVAEEQAYQELLSMKMAETVK